jgi:hypothetical protein
MRTSKGFSNIAVVGEVRLEARSAARPWTGLLLGGHGRCRALAVAALTLLAWGHPAPGQACGSLYVGRNFSEASPPPSPPDSNGELLRSDERSNGAPDADPPFVIMREYLAAGPAAAGATFCSAGTVNAVNYYGDGSYDFTVYALSLVSSNPAQNERTFTVDSEQTFTGDATTKGVHKLSADFAVGAGDFLAFAGIGPYLLRSDVAGSDATYGSLSLPNSFDAIPPTAGETFTVGVHNDTQATYAYIPFASPGRYYGIGVFYTPTAPADTLAVSDHSIAAPEPSAWAMMLIGFAGLGFVRYRRWTPRQLWS